MKIQPINCQTSFGVKYVNKGDWCRYGVDAVKRLSVVKAIKNKYPQATFIFDSTATGSISNRSYCYSLHIIIDSQTVFSVSSLNNSSKKALDSILNQLKYKTLDDMENEKYNIQEKLPVAQGHKARCNRTADMKNFL